MKLIGKRGEAFFDAWTIVHIAFWFVIGANMEHLGVSHWIRWPAALAGAYVWEVVEQWLEAHAPFDVTPESWQNRWISDPLMALIGTLLGMLIL